MQILTKKREVSGDWAHQEKHRTASQTDKKFTKNAKKYPSLFILPLQYAPVNMITHQYDRNMIARAEISRFTSGPI